MSKIILLSVLLVLLTNSNSVNGQCQSQKHPDGLHIYNCLDTPSQTKCLVGETQMFEWFRALQQFDIAQNNLNGVKTIKEEAEKALKGTDCTASFCDFSNPGEDLGSYVCLKRSLIAQCEQLVKNIDPAITEISLVSNSTSFIFPPQFECGNSQAPSLNDFVSSSEDSQNVDFTIRIIFFVIFFFILTIF